MEHKIINNLRCVNGDRSLFKQWHQNFAAARGQSDQVHEEIVAHLAKETYLGKDLDKVVKELKTIRRRVYARLGRHLERHFGHSAEQG